MAKPREFRSHPAAFPTRVYRAVCSRVIDGDTVEVLIDVGFEGYQYETIRLAVYDAPETYRASTEDERARGLEAAEYLRAMIEGRPVLIHPERMARGGGIQATLGRYVARLDAYGPDGEWRDVVEAMREAGWTKHADDTRWEDDP